MTKRAHKEAPAWNGQYFLFTWRLKLVLWYQSHPYFWCESRQIYVWIAWKIPNLSMYHLLVNTNRDIKRRWNKEKCSTVYTTVYQSKRNPTVKPRWAQPQTQHQAITLSSIDKSLSRNRQRGWGPTRRCANKEVSKIANRDWVDHQACSLLQYINGISNHVIMRNYFNKLRWKKY